MENYPESMQELIREFMKLPGVGARTAERFAFYTLRSDKQSIQSFSSALLRVNQSVRSCRLCYNLSERELCRICEDASRDRLALCVVEEPKDIIAIEKSGGFRGLYHVLLGSLSPLEGIGPQDLRVKELLERLKKEGIKEVIVATGADTEGEATAIYLARVVKPFKVKLTRIAYGIPVGSDLEFADKATLARALQSRQEI